jgi:hypothetical protein
MAAVNAKERSKLLSQLGESLAEVFIGSTFVAK